MRIVFLVVLVAGFLPITAMADGLEWVKQTIFGMDCAPCAYGVEQGLKGLSGVEGVKVSLNDGYAEVVLTVDNETTIEEIRSVVKQNGFTPKEAQIRVAGRVVAAEGSRAIVLESAAGKFSLAGSREFTTQLKNAFGERVEVTGTVSADEASTIQLDAVHSLASGGRDRSR